MHSFRHRLCGYLCAALPKKTAVLVTLYDSKKCIQRLDIKVWFMENMTVNRKQSAQVPRNHPVGKTWSTSTGQGQVKLCWVRRR